MKCKHNNIPSDYRYCPYCGMEIKRVLTLDDLIARRVNISDEVRFNLKDGTKAAVVVVDKVDNHIRCVMFEGVDDMAMYDGRPWLKVDSVNYPDSDAARRLHKFEENLPDELLDSIVVRDIIQDNNEGRHTIAAKLYPLSIYEVFGRNRPNWGLVEIDDKPISFFADSIENRKKYLWYTWLRSAYSGYSSYFCFVYTDGSAYYYYYYFAYYSYGSAPAFAI